jgi:hypothetical protein
MFFQQIANEASQLDPQRSKVVTFDRKSFIQVRVTAKADVKLGQGPLPVVVPSPKPTRP